MALSCKVGNFSQPTSTNASFAVTGVGFKPKAILLFTTNETAVGTGVGSTSFKGAATSSSNRTACANITDSSTENSFRYQDSSKCLAIVNSAGTVLVAADLVSMDSDGFTLNFSTVDANARIVGYIALGGSDLTNTFIKTFIPAGNGDSAQTGVGFKPDAIILISGNQAGDPSTGGGDNGDGGDVWGFTDGTNQQALSRDAHNSTSSEQLAKVYAKDSAGAGLSGSAVLKTMDSDGFTFTFSDFGSTKYLSCLCLKGGKFKVGTFNQATSTGNQAITGLGFQPTGLLLASINAAHNTGVITSQSRVSIGVGSNSSNRASYWSGGGGGGVQNNNIDTGKILNMITEGASPTVNTSADLVSLDSDGFTINNTSADATSREIIYMAFGSNAATTAVKMQAMKGWSFPI